ncbi:MAG: hypothetical protein IH857_03590 [Deltaproteobacteria bacterium]|nr:hypothetical protein [Deltaproteobacteria bacterium]
MIARLLIIVGLCVAASLVVGVQLLYSQRRPLFVMTPPEEKRIIVEEAHRFTIRRYVPPVEVQLLSSPDETSFATPEDVLIAHLSAMLKGDFSWMASLEGELDRKKRQGLSAEARVKMQSELKTQADIFLRGNKIILTNRFEMGDHVIIEFSVFSGESGKQVVTNFPTNFTLEGGKWKKGGLPATHPLLANYSFPGNEKRVIERKVSTDKPRAPFYIFSTKEMGR